MSINFTTMNMLYQNQKAKQEQPKTKLDTASTRVTKEEETSDKRVPPGYSCLGEYYELSCDECPDYCHDNSTNPQQMQI